MARGNGGRWRSRCRRHAGVDRDYQRSRCRLSKREQPGSGSRFGTQQGCDPHENAKSEKKEEENRANQGINRTRRGRRIRIWIKEGEGEQIEED